MQIMHTRENVLSQAGAPGSRGNIKANEPAPTATWEPKSAERNWRGGETKPRKPTEVKSKSAEEPEAEEEEGRVEEGARSAVVVAVVAA